MGVTMNASESGSTMHTTFKMTSTPDSSPSLVIMSGPNVANTVPVRTKTTCKTSTMSASEPKPKTSFMLFLKTPAVEESNSCTTINASTNRWLVLTAAAMQTRNAHRNVKTGFMRCSMLVPGTYENTVSITMPP